MRELKFRVWDQYQKTWNKNYFLSQDGMVMDLDIPADCQNIQQFTGLQDKNGKDIYEGDIIQMIYDSGKRGNIEEIKWFNGIDFDYAGWGTNTILTSQWGYSEIIGNIFENPELCK